MPSNIEPVQPNRLISQYFLITCVDPVDLGLEVTRYLSNGWYLIGGPAIGEIEIDADNGTTRHVVIQAVAK